MTTLEKIEARIAARKVEREYAETWKAHYRLSYTVDDQPMRFKMSHGPDGDIRMSRQA